MRKSDASSESSGNEMSSLTICSVLPCVCQSGNDVAITNEMR